MRPFTVLWIGIVLALAAGLAAQSSSRSGTGVIAGQILDSVTRQPVVGATVNLSRVSELLGSQAAAPGVVTDQNGRFAFRDLSAASYQLSASAPGTWPSGYGQRRLRGPSQAIDLGDGERLDDAIVELRRYGFVEGVVRDDRGRQMSGVEVRAGPVGNFPSWASTNSEGRYRARVGPGPQVVAAVFDHRTVPVSELQNTCGPLWSQGDRQPRPALIDRAGVFAMLSGAGARGPEITADRMTDRTTLYPHAIGVSDAVRVPVGAGEERGGIDIQVIRGLAVRVSGTVVGGPPVSQGHIRLRLVGAFSRGQWFDTDEAEPSADGSFLFMAAGSGQFTLVATFDTGRCDVGGPVNGWWAAVPLNIGDQDLTGLEVRMRPGVNISGTLRLESSSGVPDQGAPGVMLEPTPADALGRAAGGSQRASTFRIEGITPGRYYVRAAQKPQTGPWWLKTATFNGRDAIDEPLEVGLDDLSGLIATFTARPTTIAGIVRDTAGKLSRDASVVAFPVESRLWTTIGSPRLAFTRVTRHGDYILAGLLPGEYFVTAADDAVMDDWPAPEFLKRLSVGASRVTLADADRKTMPLVMR